MNDGCIVFTDFSLSKDRGQEIIMMYISCLVMA